MPPQTHRPTTTPASLVCLHGLGRSPADWAAVAPGLAAYGMVRAPALPRRPAPALRRAGAVVETGDILIGHSLGAILALRLAGDASRPVRAVVLAGCFFPPARNGRGAADSVRDYLAHRIAYVRALRRRRGEGGRRIETAGALLSLVGLAVRRREFYSMLAAVHSPVLVVHARDDNHVPLDFALAAIARNPTWQMRVLQRGGHHAHVTSPALWLEGVAPWLSALG